MTEEWEDLTPETLPEQLAAIAKILPAIFAKPEHNHYLHFDVCIGTQRGQPNYIKYNIYTPTIGHNDTRDYQKFMEFLCRLRDESSVPVEVKKCKDAIETANKRIAEEEYQIERAKTRLNELRIEFGERVVDNDTDLNLRDDL